MTDANPSPTAVAVHRRSIEIEAFDLGSELRVVGRLHDERPWQAEDGHRIVHDMELSVTVVKSGLVITAAEGRMRSFPHAECPQIAPAFEGLVGLSIARGYTRAVQERFAGAKGCAHLAHLSIVIGPVVMQAITSSRARERIEAEAAGVDAERVASAIPGPGWVGPGVNTCHLWAEGGIGQQKVELGWRPGRDGFPAPTLVEIRRRYQPATPPE